MSQHSVLEYRISWRRAGWSPRSSTKSKIFSRRHVAETFLKKLEGGDRPDLSPVVDLRVDCREVGEWKAVGQ